MKNKKDIIIYFSHKGENYVNGNIMNLKKGNTEVIAEKIQELTKADIFEIKTVENYPVIYRETTDMAKKELISNMRPELKEIPDISIYETIYLGYPNWWNTMPMAVFTFLENVNLEGKKIAPFCTHEGSGLGKSISDIKKICPKSTVLKGLDIYGSKVKQKNQELENWIKSME